MATLEDAADDLVVKLRSLDSEIEESERQLDDLRGRIEHVVEEVEREWSAFEAALSTFLEKAAAHESRLGDAADSSLQETEEALTEARQQHGDIRAKLDQGHGQILALTAQVAACPPELVALAAAEGEQPARELAERANHHAGTLEKAVDEVREFLKDTVVAELEQDVEDVRAEGRHIKDWMVEDAAAGLQSAFEEWDGQAEELEQLVSSQAFFASHAHAQEALSKVLDECRSRSEAHTDVFEKGAARAAQTLSDLATEAEDVGQSLGTAAYAVVHQMDDVFTTLEAAVTVLDHLQGDLAPYMSQE